MLGRSNGERPRFAKLYSRLTAIIEPLINRIWWNSRIRIHWGQMSINHQREWTAKQLEMIPVESIKIDDIRFLSLFKITALFWAVCLAVFLVESRRSQNQLLRSAIDYYTYFKTVAWQACVKTYSGFKFIFSCCIIDLFQIQI